ncbi:MAG: ferrous iron transporter B [Clostridia bacterium]|nr:ferrous iron transporter B [Clostridia bacterium]
MQHNILAYDKEIENIIFRIVSHLKGDYGISKRSVATLLLQQDEEMFDLVRRKEKEGYKEIEKMVNDFIQTSKESPSFLISKAQQETSKKIIQKVVSYNKKNSKSIAGIINRITINPITGIPLLLLVLYYGLYQFVGVFGAGTLVDYIESIIFDEHLNPYINDFVNNLIPWKVLSDLFVNEYGIITLGVKYAIAIVLPVVGCFFLMFSIIEDSGYLPRISLLMDRVFKKIGLNGRAVIPMTLGFGCDTMATMVSRTLETKRERVIATFLLALAIPCSAQLGVILALLSGKPKALAVWLIFMVLVFLLVGFLSSKVLPGEKSGFYMELPPLRLPKLKNVLKKTYVRMYWYFREVLPLFVLASVLMWFGDLTGLFQWLVEVIKPVVGLLGLPDKMSEIFLFGFFRRDYGAAGLFDLQSSGILDGRQLVVATATLTLFVPCIAQFTMMIKERGWKTAVAMAAIIFPFAFFAGFVLNRILVQWGINLG